MRPQPASPLTTKRMFNVRIKFVFLLSVKFLSLLTLVSACTVSKQPVEQPPSPNLPTAQATPVKFEIADPKPPDVEEAVKRVFKDAAVIHPDYKTNFLTGDFNGDLSQDLAVVLKPLPDKLAELNEDPRWLLRDPRAQHPHAPLRIEEDEPLLAVIHGYGPAAWRAAEATQTFLLKHVAGANMRVQDGKEFFKTNSGRKLPRIHGDLIGEKLKGSEGYLYYNAANYSWYDPKTFKGDTETTAGVFHGRNAPRK